MFIKGSMKKIYIVKLSLLLKGKYFALKMRYFNKVILLRPVLNVRTIIAKYIACLM